MVSLTLHKFIKFIKFIKFGKFDPSPITHDPSPERPIAGMTPVGAAALNARRAVQE